MNFYDTLTTHPEPSPEGNNRLRLLLIKSRINYLSVDDLFCCVRHRYLEKCS